MFSIMPNYSGFLKKRRLLLALGCAAMIVGCAGLQTQGPGPVPEIMPGFLAGYLDQDALPNSQALIPPPPAEGSAALALDEEVSNTSLALQGTPRWALLSSPGCTQIRHFAGI